MLRDTNLHESEGDSAYQDHYPAPFSDVETAEGIKSKLEDNP